MVERLYFMCIVNGHDVQNIKPEGNFSDVYFLSSACRMHSLMQMTTVCFSWKRQQKRR